MYLVSVGTCLSPPQADGDTLLNTTDAALGIAHVYQNSGTKWHSAGGVNLSTSYYSICLGLNVTLTSMIVIRVILHMRGLRRALKASEVFSGVYKTIATMIIESYALYAVAIVANTVHWATDSTVVGLFSAALRSVQVCPVFTFPQCPPVLGHCSLIAFTHRSSLHV
jgi:hypothetical protein